MHEACKLLLEHNSVTLRAPKINTILNINELQNNFPHTTTHLERIHIQTVGPQTKHTYKHYKTTNCTKHSTGNIATGYTVDPNIQHLHDETNIPTTTLTLETSRIKNQTKITTYHFILLQSVQHPEIRNTLHSTTTNLPHTPKHTKT